MHLGIAGLYDEYVAGNYDKDPFAILAESRRLTLAQIERHLARGARPPDVLDLALGTGDFLLAIRRLHPGATLAGIDISAKMIEAARRKAAAAGVEFRTVHDDVALLTRHVAPASADLVAMHFLLAYVEPRRIVAEAARALRPGGLLSVATSTLESFSNLQAAVAMLLPAGFFDAKVPQSRAELHATLAEAGLEVVEDEVHEKALLFPSYDALYEFGVPSGWFTEWFLRLSEEQVRNVRLVESQFFPFEDAARIAVLLARKTS
jgi:ubiquinone/menaquinone biosynthesis C-methylase UbiE